MRKLNFLFIFLITLPGYTLLGQESTLRGIITYEQIINYQLDQAYNDSGWKSYIADLPKTGKSIYQLLFTGQEALFKEDPSRRSVIAPKLKTALLKANYTKNPQPIVYKTHFDFQAGYITEKTEFMNRTFLVERVLQASPWKFIKQKKQMLGYDCLGAILEIGKDTLTVWYAPQLPISIGPGPYTGLPGIILGLEKNGEVFFQAINIEIRDVKVDFKKEMGRGQKVSLEKFESIPTEALIEKTKEKVSNSNDIKKGKN